MKKPSPLLSEFVTPSLDQWRTEVERLLKGAPFAKKMFTRTWEGISVSPMYTEEDTRDIPWRDSLPGQPPFVRGNHAAGYHAAPWLVAQEHRCPTCEDFNLAVRKSLARGQSAVHLIIDQAGKLGLDPDQVASENVGLSGTSVSSLADLSIALDQIDLTRYPLFVQAGGSFLPVAGMVAALAKQQAGDLRQLQGCLGADPHMGLAQSGFINSSLQQIYTELAVLTRWAVDQAPDVRTLPIYEQPWHDGGADLALSLGLTLSSAVATMRAMESQGLAPEIVAPHFQFNLEIGTDFFMELAKVRAARLLWSRILVASGVSADKSGSFIHARTARRSQSELDPHVNLLRSTTEAMSAVLGGADSLHVSAFDEVDRLPDEFSRRIACNLQLILAHECHLDQVTDPAGGSWYVESLTRDLAAAAWTQFQAAEKAGGMPEVIVSGWAQKKITAAAEARAEGYALRREVLVGTNMYPDPTAVKRPVVELDWEKLHRERTEALSDQRTSATPEAHLLVVAQLEKIMECPSDQLFNHVVNAVELGATTGEVSGVMHGETRPGLEVTPIPLRRDAEPFEKLRDRTLSVKKKSPASTRAFAANLGDYARYMPRLEFARGFFQVGGLELAGDDFYDSAAAAVDAAQADGAGIVVLVGLDATYAEQAVAVVRELANGPQPPLILLAGSPDELEEPLREAGLTAFVHVRSNVLDVLNSVLTQVEGQS